MESRTGWQPLGRAERDHPLARTPNEEAFLRLALTHALVMAGDAVVTVALAGSIFFSTDLNAARGRVLLSLLLTMAPFAVVAPFLGPAIDRSKGGRRLMVILSAAGRCLVCFFMAREVHDLVWFLPGALVLLILSKGHAVAKSALVPATVDSATDLVKAGGRLAVVGAVSGFAGGGVGAAFLNLFGADWALRLAALVYLAGAVMALRTRPAPPAHFDAPDHVDEQVRGRGVFLAATAMATIRGMSGFLTFAVAFSFRRSHAPAWWYGIVVALAIVGGFVGNLIGPALRRSFGEERLLTLSLMLPLSLGLAGAYLGTRPAIALVGLGVGLADGVAQLAFDAIVQRDGSEGSRGRSFARFEATFQLTWVASAFIPVAIPIPLWAAALIVGLAAATAAAYYAASRRIVAIVAHRTPETAAREQVAAATTWTDPDPAPVRPPGGGRSADPVQAEDPAHPGPRRNPRRVGRR